MSRNNAIATAREWLESGANYLDSETTGLNGEIVEVCVLDKDGLVLLDTLIRPTCPVEEGARNVHGITDEMLVDAPLLAEIEPLLYKLIGDAPAIGWNCEFDVSRIGTSLKAHGLNEWHQAIRRFDAMALYSEFIGRTRWQKLSFAADQCGITIPADLHRARADAELARLLVHYIAGSV